MPKPEKILVIKLGALGDFIQASGPFKAIRQHHSSETITLLTSKYFYDFAKISPWFDHIKIDHRPKPLQFMKWLKLRTWIRNSGFTRVYDLQTSDRSNFYYKMLMPFSTLDPKPDWSGIAPGCSHPHDNPRRDLMHTIDRQKEQLKIAGIDKIPSGDFSWVNTNISSFGLNDNFVIIVPGGASHRPNKRWPAHYYSELIEYFTSEEIQVVLIGGKEEKPLLSELEKVDLNCISLAGKTTLIDLFGLARKSIATIGNDTGPMHIAAASGCKTIVLYTPTSDPSLCAQRGDNVTIFQTDSISDTKPLQIIESIDLSERQKQT